VAGNDHPNLRLFPICFLCQKPKDVGQLICRHCYDKHGLRQGNPEIERQIDAAELQRLFPIDDAPPLK
jgi:hypothetical protein